MRCIICQSNSCIHLVQAQQSIGRAGGSLGQLTLGQGFAMSQQQSMEQYYAVMQALASKAVAVANEEISKAKRNKKLLLLRK